MGERIIAPLILLIGHSEQQSKHGGKGRTRRVLFNPPATRDLAIVSLASVSRPRRGVLSRRRHHSSCHSGRISRVSNIIFRHSRVRRVRTSLWRCKLKRHPRIFSHEFSAACFGRRSIRPIKNYIKPRGEDETRSPRG